MSARFAVILTMSASVLASGLAGCATDGDAPRPSALALRPTPPTAWAEDFGDPELRRLLDSADLGNLDVKSVLARLERAAAEGEKARASRSPTVDIGLAAAVGGETFGRKKTAASPTLDATYEVDLWGRRRAAVAVAANETVAAEAEVEQARRTVAAETARAYVTLRADEAGVTSADRQLELARRQSELIAIRLREGAADADASSAAADAVSTAQAVRVGALSDVAADARRLGLLSGVSYPVEPGPGDLPQTPADTAPAVSSDVVDGLPAVKAAFARLHAADARRAEAVAATRPQFQLVAALGAPDAAVSTLLDVKTLAWALAGALTQTVIDGGGRKADVARASAEADLAELAWRAAVLQGWYDLQGALADEARARSRLDIARRSAARGAAATAVAVRRHDAGAIDGVALAEVQSAEEETRIAAIRGQAALLDAVIARHLAEPTDE